MRRSPRGLVAATLLVLFFLLPDANAQSFRVRLPGGTVGATHPSECQALQDAWSNISKQAGDAHEQCLNSPSCKGRGRVESHGSCSCGSCQSLHDFRDRLGSRGDLGSQRDAQVNQCRAQVKMHQDQIANQRRMQEEAQRNAERNRAYQERLNAQYARELEQKQRENERNQPRVIASAVPQQQYQQPQQPTRQPDTSAGLLQRLTEQNNALPRQQQQQNQQDAIANVGKTLANLFAAGGIFGKKDGPPDAGDAAALRGLARANNSVRRDTADTLLNPNQDHDKQIDSAVSNAQIANSVIGRGRGTDPLVRSIQNDSLAATGSIFNNVFGEFKNKTLSDIDSITAHSPSSPPPPSSSSRSSPSYSVPSSPDPATRGPEPARPSAVSDLGALQSVVTAQPPEAAAATQPDSVSSLDALSEPARQQPSFPSGGGSVAVASLDDLEPDSPARSCRAASLQQQPSCMEQQCKLDKFRNHPTCTKARL